MAKKKEDADLIYDSEMELYSKVETKAVNWEFVVYPESAPENWMQILKDTRFPFYVSPLHDKDINPVRGDLKKPHYHVMFSYTNTTTYSYIKENFTDLVKSPFPIPCMSIVGSWKYWIHDGWPDKAQYKRSDCISINDWSLDPSKMPRADVEQIIDKIIVFAKKNLIFEYGDLQDYLMDCGLVQEVQVLRSHTLFFNSYLTSKRHSTTDMLKKAYQTISDKLALLIEDGGVELDEDIVRLNQQFRELGVEFDIIG